MSTLDSARTNWVAKPGVHGAVVSVIREVPALATRIPSRTSQPLLYLAVVIILPIFADLERTEIIRDDRADGFDDVVDLGLHVHEGRVMAGPEFGPKVKNRLG